VSVPIVVSQLGGIANLRVGLGNYSHSESYLQVNELLEDYRLEAVNCFVCLDLHQSCPTSSLRDSRGVLHNVPCQSPCAARSVF